METKTQRQLCVVQKWLDNNCIGSLVATTGFGKSYTVILAIKKLFEIKKSYVKVIIVVPTLILRDQWIELLNLHKIPAQVYVINTASKTQLECELLVIDEVHTAAAETFKCVFDTVKYEKLFNLTATIERLDGKQDLLLDKAPIIDVIALDECLKNKWVSEYQVYNLEVPFTKEEQITYNKADNSFKFFAMKLGYGNSFDTAKVWLSTGTKEQKGIAASYYNAMRTRKRLITENSGKVQTTIDIINKFSNSKFIVFSEAISFVDDLVSKVDSVVGIHSKMTKKQQIKSFELFADNRTKKRGIASCKALSAGIDIPILDLGIIASFNSSKLVNTQIIGRIIRSMEGKQANIFNLFTPETQEKRWLDKKQLGMTNLKWIKSLDEV